MSKEKKAQIIDALQETFSRCNVAVLTDYRGLSVTEITSLRRKLREAGIEYRVVKNTLARLAAEKVNRDDLTDSFVGPVAIAFGYGEIVEPARVLADFIRDSRSTLTIKGGFLADRMLTAGDVAILSRLPSREVLLARVLGGMVSPIASLVNCLSAPMTGLARVLQARITQLEGE
jgi:large subunit ribosomal protein L10